MAIRKYTVSLLFAVFLAAGMTTSVFAACTAQKDLGPVKNVTGIIHGMTEVLQTIHSMETAEKPCLRLWHARKGWRKPALPLSVI